MINSKLLIIIILFQLIESYYAYDYLFSRELSGGSASGWQGDTDSKDCDKGKLNFCDPKIKWVKVKQKTITKTFNDLPNHFQLGINIEAFIISTQDVNLLVNNVQQIKLEVIQTNNWDIKFDQGNKQLSYTLTQYTVDHTDNQFTLTLSSNDLFYISYLDIYLHNCDQTCKTCDGPLINQCLSCKDNASYNSSSKQCSCNANYYFDINGNCIQKCPEGQIFNSSRNVCSFDYCSSKNYCQQCGVGNKCLKCSSNKVLNEGLCINSCPNYTYNVNSVCVHRALMDFSASISSPVQYQYAYIDSYDLRGSFSQFTQKMINYNFLVSNTVNNLLSYFTCDDTRYFKGQEKGSTTQTFIFEHLNVLDNFKQDIQYSFNITTLDNPASNIQLKIYQYDSISTTFLEITNSKIIYTKEDDICYTMKNKEYHSAFVFKVPYSTNTLLQYKIEIKNNNIPNDQPWDYMKSFGISELTVSYILKAGLDCSSQPCQSCYIGYLFNGQCYSESCPYGTFSPSGSKICTSCLQNCQRCLDASSCQECQAGYYYFNGVCYSSSCPSGTYESSKQFYQRICKQDCQTGQALNSNEDCINCDTTNGFTIINKYCVACISNCAVCSNQSSCTKCISTYYVSNSVCAKCSQQFCLSCTSSICLVCDTAQNTQLDQSTGLCVCKAGYFYNSSTQLCEKCYYTCQLCVGKSTFCTQCDSSLNLILSNNQCVCINDYEIDQDDVSRCILILKLLSLRLDQKTIVLVFNRQLKPSEFSTVVVQAVGFDSSQIQMTLTQSQSSPNEVNVALSYSEIPVLKTIYIKFKNEEIYKEINYIPIEDSQKDQTSVNTQNNLNNLGNTILDQGNPFIKYVVYPLKYLQLLTFITNITQVYAVLILYRQYIPEEVYSFSYLTASLIFKKTPQFVQISIYDDSTTQTTGSSNVDSDKNNFNFQDLGITYNIFESCQFQSICYLIIIVFFAIFYIAKKLQTEFNYAQITYSILLNYFAGNIQGALIIVQLSLFYALGNPDKKSSDFVLAIFYVLIQVIFFGFLFIYALKKRKNSLFNQFSNLVSSLNLNNKFIRYHFPNLIIKKYLYGIMAFVLMSKPKIFVIASIIIFAINTITYTRWRFFINNFFNVIKIVQELMISITFILIVICVVKKQAILDQQFITSDELTKYQDASKIALWFMIVTFVFSIFVNICTYAYVAYDIISNLFKKKQRQSFNQLCESFVKEGELRRVSQELQQEDNTFYQTFKQRQTVSLPQHKAYEVQQNNKNKEELEDAL